MTPTNPAVPSIHVDRQFQVLLDNYVDVSADRREEKAEWDDANAAYKALIAHLDQCTAKLVADAREEGRQEGYIAVNVALRAVSGSAPKPASELPIELPERPYIERMEIYSDHGHTNMMGDDEGEYVYYSHHVEALEAFAKAAVELDRKKGAGK